MNELFHHAGLDPASRMSRKHWIPAFAGMTTFLFIVPLSQGGKKMKIFKRIFIYVFIVAFLMLEAYPLIAQEKFSILTGKVIGIRAKLWLDVESETDKAIVNFRIGYKTVYVPHRYPNPGEKVKVEYLVHRGTPVAYTVTILEASK
jgi:hypothetical protein